MTIDEEKIKNLCDDELIENIEKINEEQLSEIGAMAYVEVFNRNIYLRKLIEENRELVDEIIEEEKSFKKIYDNFYKNYLDLKLVTSINAENSFDIGELKEFRKSIVLLLRGLMAYYTEISYVSEISKRELYKEYIKGNVTEIEKNMDYEKLIKNVQMFLAEDARNIKNKVKDLLSVIPVRVSKNKYYDMVKAGLETTLKDASVEMIDIIMSRYKGVYSGTLEKEYGLVFDRYFRKAQEMRKLEFKDNSTDELNRIYNETVSIMNEMTILVNIIKEYGIVTNRLIAIGTVRDNILDKLEEDEINTLLLYWDNYLKSPKKNEEKVISQYNKVFKKLDGKFVENNENLQKFTMENFHRKNKISDELKIELEKTQYVLNWINDYTLEKEELKEVNYYKKAEESYLKQSINNLIESIDRNSKEFSNIQRKSRMKRLITLVDGAFPTPNEFFEYFANSINLTSKDEELAVIVNEILEVMNYYRAEKNSNVKNS